MKTPGPHEFFAQSQGPDEPVFVVGPEPRRKFICRMDEGSYDEKIAAAEYIAKLLNAGEGHIPKGDVTRTHLEVRDGGYTLKRLSPLMNAKFADVVILPTILFEEIACTLSRCVDALEWYASPEHVHARSVLHSTCGTLEKINKKAELRAVGQQADEEATQ